MIKRLRRCPWASDPLNVRHHDQEWGVLCHDDRRLFEMLILEGAQAGLSWSTIWPSARTIAGPSGSLSYR
jgi:DNA-3-methyladenine glycosylase I